MKRAALHNLGCKVNAYETQAMQQLLEQAGYKIVIFHFYEMHIFKYSKRKGTKAAVMDGQIPEAVKAQRSAALIALGEKMSKDYRDSFIGAESSVLLEEPFVYDGKKYEVGYTKEYLKIAVESEKNRSNTVVRGKITGYLTQDIYIMVEF